MTYLRKHWPSSPPGSAPAPSTPSSAPARCITFPVLLAVGLPPVTANVSNTLGLVPGSVSGAIGYRRELAGQRRPAAPARRRRPASAALTGAVLLVTLPSQAFDTIVPVLIALALVLVVAPATALPRRPGPPRPQRRRAPPRTAARCSSADCSSPASTAATSAPPRA